MTFEEYRDSKIDYEEGEYILSVLMTVLGLVVARIHASSSVMAPGILRHETVSTSVQSALAFACIEW